MEILLENGYIFIKDIAGVQRKLFALFNSNKDKIVKYLKVLITLYPITSGSIQEMIRFILNLKVSWQIGIYTLVMVHILKNHKNLLINGHMILKPLKELTQPYLVMMESIQSEFIVKNQRVARLKDLLILFLEKLINNHNPSQEDQIENKDLKQENTKMVTNLNLPDMKKLVDPFQVNLKMPMKTRNLVNLKFHKALHLVNSNMILITQNQEE